MVTTPQNLAEMFMTAVGPAVNEPFETVPTSPN
jgi:hypothetical protein